MSANPHANGGSAARAAAAGFLRLCHRSPKPGGVEAEATRILGNFLRDVMKLNAERTSASSAPMKQSPIASPRCFEVTQDIRRRNLKSDEDLAPDGRVMEVLSEHLCEGWCEGYLLTGRHGLFNCYEAFIHIVDSMFNQHAKWLKVTRHIPWRRPIASLNYLLSSHVWRQDHNGFSHQDPASSITW